MHLNSIVLENKQNHSIEELGREGNASDRDTGG
jgi:hypothetical protein